MSLYRVKFSVENLPIDANSAATWLQFDDRCLFVMLLSKNQLEYWNSDFSAFIGHQFLCEIFVRFGSVTR